MSFWRPPAKRALSAAAQANIARVQEIWTDARAKYGAGGPFLFGKFSAADAMYAPVVQRFIAYDDRRQRAGESLHAGDDRAAGMAGMAPRRAARDLGHSEVRVRLARGEAPPGGSGMKLVIGNKNYSSWSFRPWIAMTALGIPFEEILIPFGTPLGNPDFRAARRRTIRRPASCRC